MVVGVGFLVRRALIHSGIRISSFQHQFLVLLFLTHTLHDIEAFVDTAISLRLDNSLLSIYSFSYKNNNKSKCRNEFLR